MGKINQSMDQDERTQRQLFYNSGIDNRPVRVGESISEPDVLEKTFPFGSVAIDSNGYTLLSALFEMSEYLSPVLVTKLYNPEGDEVSLEDILFSGDFALPEGDVIVYPIMIA
jgi:hypothetical protein